MEVTEKDSEKIEKIDNIVSHCGLKNILQFLSSTPKTNGGHENRAKSVWESSFIEILDLPPWP